jgi:LPXTG-site transpeptidase (sortase) family protein
MLNPLFPSNNNDSDDKKTGAEPFHTIKRHDKKIEPIHKGVKSEPNPAADLIRQKLQSLYDHEPSAKQEIAEVKNEPKPVSKHQRYMQELSTSGKSLAEIQTAWHNYYLQLPDHEKHEVWQEFYDNSAKNSHYHGFVEQHRTELTEQQPQAVNPNADQVVVADHTPVEHHERPSDNRTAKEIKRQIAGRVSANGKLTAKHHIQSVLFGLGIGFIVVVITLFSFFNEYIIAPFIQPSRQVSATPIIIGADDIAASSTPEVIIPKINVEIPLNFSVGTTNEDQIENALEDGVVHYPTTVLPGQKGNTAFFGHSSNNIFNPGHYKFAFVLLHELVPGDTFYLTYNGKVYVYQVYDKQIVDPSNVSVLGNVPGKVATATLITCDPPGTSLHRLVVWGEQVSPSPTANAAGDNTSSSIPSTTQLPSNGPSLWSRLTSWL